MAIQFVVETGAALSNATSYVSVAEYKQYYENRGIDYTSVSDATIQAKLNVATEYIDNNYNFAGCIVDEEQALSFPRSCLYKNGIAIDSDVIPQDLKDAVCYIADKVKNGMIEQVDSGIKSESFGPVSKTYSETGQKKYPALYKYLKAYIRTGAELVRLA